MMAGQEIKPRPYWWKTSALTTTPILLSLIVCWFHMVFSNVVIEITILSRSFVFCNTHWVSPGLTNVSGLAITAFDHIHCTLSALGVVFVFDILLVSIVASL